MKNRRAFTLIELLVVIAVIAVLMGILMPALSVARKQARGAACLSQLRQWGMIWMIFTEDHDGKFPDGEKGAISSGGWNRGFWVTVLRSGWEKKPKLLLCPSAKKFNMDRMQGSYDIYGSFDAAYNFPSYLDVVDNPISSYGMNLWANYITVPMVQNRKREYHWQRLQDVKHTTEVPLFLDAMWRGGGPHYDSENAFQRPQMNGDWKGYDREMMHFAMVRHGNGVNSLFMDGSVRKVKVRDLWSQRWHKGYDTTRSTRMSADWWGDWLGGDRLK